MALRFADSFDHYTTLTQKWTSITGGAGIGAAYARTGAQGLRIWGNPASIALTIDAQGTWIIGVAFRIPAIGITGGIAGDLDVGAAQGSVRINVDGTLSLLRGAAVVATSVNALLANVFYYIEFKHIIANAGGLLEVRVNGAVWATFTGDTQATANATANQITLISNMPAGPDLSFDDLYVLDGVDQSIADPNSPPNNDYLGDTQIECLVPVGAGFYTELATLFGAPTHWQAEDEVPADEDTSYVEDAVVDVRDTYAMTNLSVVSATIPGVQISARARKTVAGVASFARMYRRIADYQGVDVALGIAYLYYREIMGGDPQAAGAWTVAAINATEIGFRVR